MKKCGDDVSDKLREKWLQEIAIMNQINHQNIVRALQTPDEMKHYNPSVLVMEYCSGGDLRGVSHTAALLPCVSGLPFPVRITFEYNRLIGFRVIGMLQPVVSPHYSHGLDI